MPDIIRPDETRIEGDLRRTVQGLRGLAGLLIAVSRSRDQDPIDFEHIGELAHVLAIEADRAVDQACQRLYA